MPVKKKNCEAEEQEKEVRGVFHSLTLLGRGEGPAVLTRDSTNELILSPLGAGLRQGDELPRTNWFQRV